MQMPVKNLSNLLDFPFSKKFSCNNVGQSFQKEVAVRDSDKNTYLQLLILILASQT